MEEEEKTDTNEISLMKAIVEVDLDFAMSMTLSLRVLVEADAAILIGYFIILQTITRKIKNSRYEHTCSFKAIKFKSLLSSHSSISLLNFSIKGFVSRSSLLFHEITWNLN